MAVVWTVPIVACLFVKTCLILMQQPLPVVTTSIVADSHLQGGRAGGGSPLLYIPPRAYFLCWKGVCDPRIWDEMAKRAPAIYSFGLGKRSVAPADNDDVADEDESSNEDATTISGAEDQLDDQTMHVEKRARYSFGVGKKNESPYRRFNFGLGKRSASSNRFAFGLGKRANEDDDGDYSDDGHAEVDYNDAVATDSVEAVNNEIDKRKMSYNFGLGKRYFDDDDNEESDVDKRDKMYSFGLGKRDKMYSFGLGKRDGKMYSFGLGKRDGKMYSFGLGKRDKAYSFGLGKRYGSGRPDHLYAFGLGKREPEDSLEYLNSDTTADKRASGGPYSFGLGKRSVPQQSMSHVDKRGASDTKMTPEDGGDNKRTKLASSDGKHEEDLMTSKTKVSSVSANEPRHH